MKLADLTPKEVHFTVCEIELTFRPFTIADDLKAQELCGGKKKREIAFQEFDFEKISLVAWYQLTLESQKIILNRTEAVYIDPETGRETKANKTPLERFRAVFVGIADELSLLTNLVKCKGHNIPELDDEEALEKWIGQLNIGMQLIGLKSST